MKTNFVEFIVEVQRNYKMFTEFMKANTLKELKNFFTDYDYNFDADLQKILEAKETYEAEAISGVRSY